MNEEVRAGPPRRSWRAAGLTAAGTAAAWLLLDALPWPARLWTTLLLVPFPVAVSAQLRFVGDPVEIPRIPVYLSSTVSLWILALITAIAARVAGFSREALGLVGLPVAPLMAWSLSLTAAGIAVLFAARALGVKESGVLRRLIPVTASEKNVFAGLSITAAICEELVFRGFLIHALILVSGSTTVALLLSSAVFGWMHAYQDLGGAIRAGSLGALLALPFVLHGSILPAVLAHAAIDLISGLFLGDRLSRDVA